MRESDDQINTARALLDLARAQRATGDVEGADLALREAVIIAGALGIHEIKLLVHQELAEIAASRGHLDLADHHRREAAAARHRYLPVDAVFGHREDH